MTLTTEVINVTGVSQYSLYSNNVRYGFNKGVDSTMFQKGHTYSVAVSIGKNGAKYIQRVDSDLGGSAPQSEAPTTVLNPSLNTRRPSRAKMGEPLTDYDLETQERISRAGVMQAAVNAVTGHASSVEDLKVKATDLAEYMLTWVNNRVVSTPVK